MRKKSEKTASFPLWLLTDWIEIDIFVLSKQLNNKRKMNMKYDGMEFKEFASAKPIVLYVRAEE